MSLYEWTIHDLRTGAPLLDVTPRDQDATARMSGEGQGKFDFHLADRKIPRDTIRDLLRPSDRFLVVKTEDGIAYVGSPQKNVYDRDTQIVTCTTVEVRRLFRWRLTHGVRWVLTLGDLSVSNKSGSGAVRAILNRGMLDGDPAWTLPIDLPADGSGDFSASWLGSDLFTINDLLVQVEKEGYDILFRPYDDDGSLRFETHVGAPVQLGYTDLPATAAMSSVTGLTVTQDGLEQVTGVFVAGYGKETSMVSAYRDLIDVAPGGVNNYAIRDAYWQSKEIKDPDQLQRIANARFAEFNPTLEQWTLELDCSEGLPPMVGAPGRVLRVDTRDDPWIPDGYKDLSAIALNVDMTSKVTVQVR